MIDTLLSAAKWVFLAVVGLVGLAAAILFYDMGPGGSGVLAAKRLPDGSEYMVTQKYNGQWAEPYTVSFYMRKPGQPWGWCYIDHQDSRRTNVRLSYDQAADTVVVTDNGKRRAALDRRRDTFWLQMNHHDREEHAPQTEGVTPEYPFPY